MAKPRIFISSTFYDLRQVRSDLDSFIESLGYESVRNEEGDISYGKEEALEEYCYKEIKTIDILISIVGSRYGSESKRGNSISQNEFKAAISENKQIYIFIENNVLSEYETYLINKDLPKTKYKYVDDVRIYQFIEEVKSLSLNNNIKGFDTASDITRYLKDQFAGLFQRFLEGQTRIKEISLITKLEKTAQTLNQLVNYLSDENKGQAEEVNRILMINHPLVENLKTLLSVPYNFYIEGKVDLNALVEARGFKPVEFDIIESISGYSLWIKDIKRKKFILKISNSIFEKDGKLKFAKKTDWVEDYIKYSEVDAPKDDDDLPF